MTDTDPTPRSLSTGSRGAYDWLTTEHSFELLLERCPELVLGKYLAVTSTDSGLLIPDERRQDAGWESRGGIACSPRVQSIEDLPREGFDEWYVFSSVADLGVVSRANVFEAPLTPGRVEVFANFYGFRLHDLDTGFQTLVALFWKQMEWIQPESYIADGDRYLTVVSNNKGLFGKVREALR